MITASAMKELSMSDLLIDDAKYWKILKNYEINGKIYMKWVMGNIFILSARSNLMVLKA